MAGLLALSASHKAVLAHSSSIASLHYNQSVSLYEQYQKGRSAHVERPMPGYTPEEDTLSSFNTSSRGLPTPRKEVLDQLGSVMECTHALFLVKKHGALPTLEAFIAMMRRLVAPGVTLRPSDFRQTNGSDAEDAFGRAARLMDTPVDDPILSTVLSRVSSLPTRMAEALGRPEGREGLRPVIVALSAIATLIDSCVAGFESDEAAFWAMATWLSGAADEFHDMVVRYEPAALIVLAHWAASLARRVEENGCWFLKGASAYILSRIKERLPDNALVHELVNGL